MPLPDFLAAACTSLQQVAAGWCQVVEVLQLAMRSVPAWTREGTLSIRPNACHPACRVSGCCTSQLPCGLSLSQLMRGYYNMRKKWYAQVQKKGGGVGGVNNNSHRMRPNT
jgi:hypothetical protein